MRIAEIAEFYAPNGGGVRTYIDRKFHAAADAGHELFVLAPGPRDAFEPRPGGGVVWIKAPTLPFDANYHLFWEPQPVHDILDQLRADVVEASSPWKGAWIAAAWKGEARRALFMHADPISSYPQRWFSGVTSHERIDRMFDGFWRYLARLSHQFDTTVAGGGWLASRLRHHGVGPVTVVGLGVDRTAFSPELRSESLRARLLADCDLPPSATLLVGIGRHHAEKRWPTVIEAATIASHASPIGLMLVGDGMDRAGVERAVGGNPHVRLVEPIRDRQLLARILASADALIHGCDCETFGLVAAEALASGTPLIVPDRGGCADMADVAVAELYRAGDSRAAADAIARLFARDPQWRRAASLKRARQVRSDRQHFSELFDHYGALRALQTLPAARSA